MTNEEAIYPTMSLEALMLLRAIDAKENRCVAETEIPGAFLHVDMEGIVHMVLEGEIAKLNIKLDPETYKNYIWHKWKGKLMISIQLKKA